MLRKNSGPYIPPKRKPADKAADPATGLTAWQQLPKPLQSDLRSNCEMKR